MLYIKELSNNKVRKKILHIIPPNTVNFFKGGCQKMVMEVTRVTFISPDHPKTHVVISMPYEPCQWRNPN